MFAPDILGELGKKVFAWLLKAHHAWHDWLRWVCLWGPETPALFQVGNNSVFVSICGKVAPVELEGDVTSELLIPLGLDF